MAKAAEDTQVENPDGSTQIVPASVISDLWMEKARARGSFLRSKPM